MCGRVAPESLLPYFLLFPAFSRGLTEITESLLRYEERGVKRPTEVLLGRFQLFRPERRTVRRAGILLLRGAEADGRAQTDERRPRRFGLCSCERPVDRHRVIPVFDGDHMPAGGGEPLVDIFGKTEQCAPRKGDPVIVVQKGQLPQSEVSGKRTGLCGEPFHQIAVAGKNVGSMIDDRMFGSVETSRQVRLRDRHSDRRPDPLAEGARCHFHPGGMQALRMAGRFAPPLAERLQVVEGEVVSGEIKERIEEHRGMPGRQDETVPVGPERIGRIVLQMARPEGEGGRGRPHRHAGVAGLRLFNGIRSQETDRVDALLLEFPIFVHRYASSSVTD